MGRGPGARGKLREKVYKRERKTRGRKIERRREKDEQGRRAETREGMNEGGREGKKRKAEREKERRRAKQRQTKRDEEKGRRVPRNKATENVTLEAVNWSVPVLVARSQRFARIPVPRDVSICLDDREEISSGPRGKQLQTAKLLR